MLGSSVVLSFEPKHVVQGTLLTDSVKKSNVKWLNTTVHLKAEVMFSQDRKKAKYIIRVVCFLSKAGQTVWDQHSQKLCFQ